MSTRSVNFYDTVQWWTKHLRPDTAFTGSTKAGFRKWRRTFLPHYRGMLGPWPEAAKPNVEVTRTERLPGFTRTRIMFNSSPGVTVPAFLLEPAGLRKGEKRPGILAAHGHGNGKADICGTLLRGSPKSHLDWVRSLNYDYAVQAVKRGYIVIAPDWIPFGERKPPVWWYRSYRDVCDIANHAAMYFGRTLLAQNVWDGMRAVDILERHPNIDPQRLGVIGLSYGGTMATHLLVNDPRLKAGVVAGYISTVRGDALNRRGKGNTCGAQVVPHLLVHGDIPEMLGLACPKPVLCEIGTREDCFHYPDMVKAFRTAKRIWTAAGVPERLDADIFSGKHMWSGRKAWAFLEAQL